MPAALNTDQSRRAHSPRFERRGAAADTASTSAPPSASARGWRADSRAYSRGLSERGLRDLRRLHELLDEIAAEELRLQAREIAAEGLRRNFPAGLVCIGLPSERFDGVLPLLLNALERRTC